MIYSYGPPGVSKNHEYALSGCSESSINQLLGQKVERPPMWVMRQGALNSLTPFKLPSAWPELITKLRI